MSDRDKWKEFDLAESSLIILISYYSEIIYEEQHKNTPDSEKIGAWKAERRALELVKRGLDPENQFGNANISAKYGEAARAALQKHKP